MCQHSMRAQAVRLPSYTLLYRERLLVAPHRLLRKGDKTPRKYGMRRL
jgi:hypothetical protein